MKRAHLFIYQYWTWAGYVLFCVISDALTCVWLMPISVLCTFWMNCVWLTVWCFVHTRLDHFISVDIEWFHATTQGNQKYNFNWTERQSKSGTHKDSDFHFDNRIDSCQLNEQWIVVQQLSTSSVAHCSLKIIKIINKFPKKKNTHITQNIACVFENLPKNRRLCFFIGLNVELNKFSWNGNNGDVSAARNHRKSFKNRFIQLKKMGEQ